MPKPQPHFSDNFPTSAQPLGITQLSFILRLPLGLSATCIGGLDIRKGWRPERDTEEVLRYLQRAERERCEAAKARRLVKK